MSRYYEMTATLEEAIVTLGEAGWRVVPVAGRQTKRLFTYAVSRNDYSTIIISANKGEPASLDFRECVPADDRDFRALDPFKMKLVGDDHGMADDSYHLENKWEISK